MKNVKMVFASLMFALLFIVAGNNSAKAQTAAVGDLLAGLVNVNVSLVEAAVATGDITVEDVVDVTNVLNRNDVDVLNNAINNNDVASDNQIIITNLLRDADILNKNQVVVGLVLNVLGGVEQVVVANTNRKAKR